MIEFTVAAFDSVAASVAVPSVSLNATRYPTSAPTSNPVRVIASRVRATVSVPVGSENSLLPLLKKSNYIGTLYCAAFLAGTSITSRGQVRSSPYYTTISSPGTMFVNVSVSGLAASTTYDFYCYFEDTSGQGSNIAQVLHSKVTTTTSCCRQVFFSNPPNLLSLGDGSISNIPIQYSLESIPDISLTVTPVYYKYESEFNGSISEYYKTQDFVSIPPSVTFQKTSKLSSAFVLHRVPFPPTAVPTARPSSAPTRNRTITSYPSSGKKSSKYCVTDIHDIIYDFILFQAPSLQPSSIPTSSPSLFPTNNPTLNPTVAPSLTPTLFPSSTNPTLTPTLYPTISLNPTGEVAIVLFHMFA